MATKLPQIPAITKENVPAVLQAIKDIIELRSGQRPEAAGSQFITKDTFEANPVWQAPVFVNSWVNYGSGFNNAGFTKDRSGVIRLRGLIKSGTVTASAFVLPVGFRPAQQHLFAVISNGAIGRVDVQADGEVVITAGSNVYVSLDNIAFLPA